MQQRSLNPTTSGMGLGFGLGAPGLSAPWSIKVETPLRPGAAAQPQPTCHLGMGQGVGSGRAVGCALPLAVPPCGTCTERLCTLPPGTQPCKPSPFNFLGANAPWAHAAREGTHAGTQTPQRARALWLTRPPSPPRAPQDLKVMQPGGGTAYSELLASRTMGRPIYQAMSSGLTNSTAQVRVVHVLHVVRVRALGGVRGRGREEEGGGQQHPHCSKGREDQQVCTDTPVLLPGPNRLGARRCCPSCNGACAAIARASSCIPPSLRSFPPKPPLVSSSSLAQGDRAKCQGGFEEDLVGLRYPPGGSCTFFPKPNFGMVDVDWAARVARLQVGARCGAWPAVCVRVAAAPPAPCCPWECRGLPPAVWRAAQAWGGWPLWDGQAYRPRGCCCTHSPPAAQASRASTTHAPPCTRTQPPSPTRRCGTGRLGTWPSQMMACDWRLLYHLIPASWFEIVAYATYIFLGACAAPAQRVGLPPWSVGANVTTSVCVCVHDLCGGGVELLERGESRLEQQAWLLL